MLGHRRETRHVSWSLVAVEGVEQSAVEHRIKRAPQRCNWNASAAANSTSIPRSSAFSRAIASAVSATSTPRTEIPARRREGVLAGAAARIEHRPANPPSAATRRLPAAARRYPKAQARRGTTHPRAARHPFVTGRVPTTDIVSGVPDRCDNSSRSCADLATSSWHANPQVLTIPPTLAPNLATLGVTCNTEPLPFFFETSFVWRVARPTHNPIWVPRSTAVFGGRAGLFVAQRHRSPWETHGNVQACHGASDGTTNLGVSTS